MTTERPPTLDAAPAAPELLPPAERARIFLYMGGLIVLLVVLWLNVYKPRGLTPYGWRKQQEQRRALQRSKQDEQRKVPQL